MAAGDPRPFQPDADGTCLASASMTLILESEESAACRGAQPYGEVLSVATLGVGADEGTEEVATWSRCLELALDRAHVKPNDVGYCAAAAAGVADHNAPEQAALAEVFGPSLRVGAPKAILGETMGASGLVGAIAALLALRTGHLAPNPSGPTDGLVDHVTHPASLGDADVVLSNCLAPGSGVASALFGRTQRNR